jgi:hypothetical protein
MGKPCLGIRRGNRLQRLPGADLSVPQGRFACKGNLL